jgi:hypothetical protein
VWYTIITVEGRKIPAFRQGALSIMWLSLNGKIFQKTLKNPLTNSKVYDII